MVQTRWKGRVTSLVLQSGNIVTSGNFKSMRWKERDGRIQPETVANTTLPVGWHQGHRWTDVEMKILGEATEILGSGTALVSSTGDNLVMTSCGATFVNHLGSSMYVLVGSPIIDSIESNVDDYSAENITTIRMKAYYVTLPALA